MKIQRTSLTVADEIFTTSLLAKAIQHMPDEEIGWIDQGCYFLTVHLPSNHSYSIAGYAMDEIPNFLQLIYRKIRQAFGFCNEKRGTQVGMIAAGDLRGTRTGSLEYSMDSYHLHALIILPEAYRPSNSEDEHQVIDKMKESIMSIKEIELHYGKYFSNDKPHLVSVSGSDGTIGHIIDYVCKSSKKHVADYGGQVDVNILPYQYLVAKESKRKKIDSRVIYLTASLHLRKERHFISSVNRRYQVFQQKLLNLIIGRTAETEGSVKNRILFKLL